MRFPDPARWISHEPTTHATRDAEWLCALALTGWACILALPGNSLANPAFAPLHRLGFTEVLCSTVVGAIGVMRLAALYINGRSPRTPRFRVAGAFLGMLVWLQLAVAILVGNEEAYGAVPPATAILAALALFEARSLLKASFDVRYQR